MRVFDFGVPSAACSAGNVIGRIFPGNGSPITFVSNASFQGGTPITPFNPPLGDVVSCPGPDPRCSTNGVVPAAEASYYAYTIQPADETGEVEITDGTPCPFAFNNPDGAHRVAYFFLTGTGASHSASGSDLPFQVCSGDAIEILHPNIACSHTCTISGGSVTFMGTVTNAGDAGLFNVTVSNLVNGSFVLVTNVASLDAGQSFGFAGNYFPGGPCRQTTNSVVVSATDELGLTVTNSSVCSASCPQATSVLLSNASVAGDSFSFSFATENNRRYTIEFTDSLAAINWQILTSFTADGSLAKVSFNRTNTARFYRVNVQ